MTAAGGARVATRSAGRDPLSAWCGWVLVGLAALAPLMAWLGPLGFAPLVALAGLLTLPAVRMTDEDRPALIVLFAALIWAAVSTTWSPYHPKHPQDGAIVKLAFQLPLYWSAVCAARRADPLLARRALAVLAWGFAALGLMLIVEAATGGAIYRAIHIAFYEPIRPDLARKNVAQSTFVLALLWPLAALGVTGRLRPALAAPMVLGVAVAGVRFGADAPVISLLLGALAALCVWRCPRRGPKAFAGLAAAIFLLMPLIVWSVREFADYSAIEHLIPLSWAERMGYWSHAVDWIWDQPLRGWGLDASRMFAPAIQLHPHDSALQVWLELGAVGGLLAAAFWGVTLPRLARPGPDLVAAATAACCAAYLLFGGVNFGVWQEWWLALGSLVAVLSALNGRTAPAAELSTSAPISE